MFDPATWIVFIPALPLAATLITAALGKWLLKEASHWPTVIATATAFVLSVILLFNVAGETGTALPGHAAGEAAANPSAEESPKTSAKHTVGYERVRTLWSWADVHKAKDTQPLAAQGTSDPPKWSDFRIDVTLRVDPLTCTMLCVVLFVSSLVAIYAIGYMSGDPGYWRFFTYISLFIFSMTMLVSVSNLALLYVFWEAVGACSYLLVGFWYEKPSAAAAGKKAFLVNRVGDFGFAIALFLIWCTYGTLNFHDADGVAGVLGQTRLLAQDFAGGGVGLAIALLLLLGACGKSAQFPLHVWLPDAMEGPTPVSALIHAATMVTAGVYMIARTTPLYLAASGYSGPVAAHDVVAAIGCFTALMAALIAVVQTDLKRVLAYSTISQLGYMFLGLGVGTIAGISAGMFHLVTHAFFKALLFLAAGSVMHAMGGIIDMRRFSGLRRLMPVTHWTFLFGALALAGVIPFAGFWSKDMIIGAVHERAMMATGSHGNLIYDPQKLFEVLYWVSLIAAWLTAFYTFRGFFCTFYGPEKIPVEAGHHAHEAPPVMTIPLAILAFFALTVGAYFEWTHGLFGFLGHTPSLAYAPIQATGGAEAFAFHTDVAAISTLVALAGVGLAAFLYLGARWEVRVLTRIMQALYLYPLAAGKFFFDQIYGALVVWPLRMFSNFLAWSDGGVVDAVVNFCGRVPVRFGSALRGLQAGLVQSYALCMIFGLIMVLIGTLLLK